MMENPADIRFIELVRYGFAEILGEPWLHTHPINAIQDLCVGDVVNEGIAENAAYGIAVRAGSSTFNGFCSQYGPQMGLLEGAFQLQPVQTRITTGLTRMIQKINDLTGMELTLHETASTFDIILSSSSLMTEYYFGGFFQAFFDWASNGKTFLYQHCKDSNGQAVVSFNKKPMEF
ncbi:MAG: hypothetical protein K8R40_06890 [Anaerolineaceae bacterium]|nr:hypothetical protein [Anaerolineaceae bacterium]